MRLLYFAWVRERIGKAGEEIIPSADISTVDQLLDWLAAKSGGHAEALADRTRLRAAIDGRYVPLDAPLDGA
uniref:MoaD/ThiS family protein n=1 Tax=Sphingomonas sp. TaxID=28214 RepID=UPI003B3B7937